MVGRGVWDHVLSVSGTLPRLGVVTRLGPDRDSLGEKSPKYLLPGLDQETELEGATQIPGALMWRPLCQGHRCMVRERSAADDVTSD